MQPMHCKLIRKAKKDQFMQTQKLRKTLYNTMSEQVVELINLMISFLKSDDCNYISEQVLKRLTSVTSNSRRILNILNLIEFLLKNGSSKFKGEIEEERFYLKKMKDNFNDDYDILHKPIQNIINKIIELLQNPDLLQQERETAKKIRDRIKGVSNETPVQDDDNIYNGFSSDDLQKQQSYDIKPEINLKKKLGFDVDINDKQNEVQNNTQQNDNQQQQSQEQNQQQDLQDDIDFLGVMDNDIQQKQTQQQTDQEIKKDGVQKITQQTKPKKKVFLPPPPKKGKNQTKVYHKKPSNLSKQSQQQTTQDNPIVWEDDFSIDKPQQQNQQNNNIQNDIIDLDFLGQDDKNIEQKQQKKEEQNQNNDFDFSNLDLKQEKKENQMDNYLNFLQSTNANRLPQPPKKVNNNPQDKYDFF